MTRKEYLTRLEKVSIDENAIKRVEEVYGHALPTEVKQMILISKRSIFFDDEWRTLSPEEVIDAPNDLHVDFRKLGIVPLIDCGENDFIVYHMSDQSWSKYNIADGTIFKKRPQLSDLFR